MTYKVFGGTFSLTQSIYTSYVPSAIAALVVAIRCIISVYLMIDVVNGWFPQSALTSSVIFGQGFSRGQFQ